MTSTGANLGVCFYADRLFYAINDPNDGNRMQRIGALRFNFSVHQALFENEGKNFQNLKSAFSELHKDFNIKSSRILTDPNQECWTILPKLVYDNPDEREDHIGVMMQGVKRELIEPIWHGISNNDYRFLCLRRTNIMQGYNNLTSDIGMAESVSDFELGEKWETIQKKGGSYLLIGCQQNSISVSSYILGKLRAATYIFFDDLIDLPYLWLQRSKHMNWMRGIHEEVYVYGYQAYTVIEALQGFWDDSSIVSEVKDLETIGVTADEETYGFDLGCVFPAVIIAMEN